MDSWPRVGRALGGSSQDGVANQGTAPKRDLLNATGLCRFPRQLHTGSERARCPSLGNELNRRQGGQRCGRPAQVLRDGRQHEQAIRIGCRRRGGGKSTTSTRSWAWYKGETRLGLTAICPVAAKDMEGWSAVSDDKQGLTTTPTTTLTTRTTTML